MKHNLMELGLLYRCAGNYKTFFSWNIDLNKYPDAAALNKGDDIEMGKYGTPTRDEFFNSDYRAFVFDPDLDHNLFDVVSIVLK